MMLHAGGCPGALGTARSQRPPIPRILGARGASPRCTPRQERHAATSAVAGKDPVVFPSGPLPIPAGPVQHKDHAGPLVFVFRLSPFMPPLRDPAPPPDRSPPFRRFQAVSGPGWALWAERDYDVLDYIRLSTRCCSGPGGARVRPPPSLPARPVPSASFAAFRYKGSRLDRVLCRLSGGAAAGAGGGAGAAAGGWRLGSIKLVGTEALPGLVREHRGKRLPVLPSDHFGLLVKLLPSEAPAAGAGVGRTLGSGPAAPPPAAAGAAGAAPTHAPQAAAAAGGAQRGAGQPARAAAGAGAGRQQTQQPAPGRPRALPRAPARAADAQPGQPAVEPLQQHAGLADGLAADVAAALA
ncbi:hypothetical protein TSOC_013863, partial [Tetrabaena socialis]